MRSHCTARKQVNSGKPIDHWKFLSGKYPAIRRASSNVCFSPQCQCSFFGCKFTNNMRTLCSLYPRLLLVDVPVSIRLAIEGIVNHVIGVACNILCIGSSIFTIVSAVIIFVIVVVVFHIVFVFELRCKGTACVRTQCSHSGKSRERFIACSHTINAFNNLISQ